MKNLKKITAFIMFILLSCHLSAHKYFFALSELTINSRTQQLEVIHYITVHDLENAIALAHDINFSPEHPKYESLIRQYIEQHFTISYQSNALELKYIGMELAQGKIVIYQKNQQQNFLTGLVVKNDLLINTYNTQINTLNYQHAATTGSLTFDNKHREIKITD